MPPLASTVGAGGEKKALARLDKARIDARDAGACHGEFISRIMFDDSDGRSLTDGGDERFHDRLARAVAAYVNNAAMAMRRFAPDGEMAFEVAVKGNAIAQKIGDTGRGLARHRDCDILVNDACARNGGVSRVRLGRVALFDGRRDSTLRPGARRAIAQGSCGEHSDRAGCEFQGRKKTGKTCADDENIAGILGIDVGHGLWPLMREAARVSSRD